MCFLQTHFTYALYLVIKISFVYFKNLTEQYVNIKNDLQLNKMQK